MLLHRHILQDFSGEMTFVGMDSKQQKKEA